MKQPEKKTRQNSKTEVSEAVVVITAENAPKELTTIETTWGLMKESEGAMIAWVDRAETKTKLETFSTDYRHKLDKWKKKSVITEADLKQIDKERLEVRAVRLIPYGVEKKNNNIINAVKKRLTSENEELIEIPEKVETAYEKFIAEQKEKIANAEEERKERLKTEIITMESAAKEMISKSTLADFETSKANIEHGMQEYIDNPKYDGFEVMMELAVDRVKDAIDDHKKILDEAELKRVGAIEAKLATIESEANKVMLNMNYASLIDDADTISTIYSEPYDYQEFAENFTSLKNKLIEQFETKSAAIKQSETDRQELNLFRRLRILKENGFIEMESGDYTLPGLEETLVYAKNFIASDNDEVFFQTMAKFELSRPKEVIESTQEVESVKEEVPVTKFEKAIAEVAESNKDLKPNESINEKGYIVTDLTNEPNPFIGQGETQTAELTQWTVESDYDENNRFWHTITDGDTCFITRDLDKAEWLVEILNNQK